MLFNSLAFLLFFPLTALIYFSLPHRFRWMWLLAASCYFYMAFVPHYILILFFLIGLDYTLGRCIEPAQGRKRRWLLITSIVANIGMLFVFKYFNFFAVNVETLAQTLHWNYSLPLLRLVLPLGLSFHIFQSLSYVIEVYRGTQKAERHLGIYALYVLFFPQLVAGPIERPEHMLHQFHETHRFDPEQVREGLTLMLRGFFKKLVIADRLALLVNHVYGNISEANGLSLVIATIAFAIQIYCDFSGYSDIAVGAARILGYKLMTNFDKPYSATSIADFWRRWHISLSSWFRDYVYIPLGGNRVSTIRKYFNILFVFLLSGLWHGANWTFIVWGLWHGMLIVLSDATASFRASTPRFIQVATTFGLVTFGWIFFRAQNLHEAFTIIRRLPQDWAFRPQALGVSLSALAIVALSLGMLKLFERPRLNTGLSYLLILWVLFFGYTGSTSFIYFQF